MLISVCALVLLLIAIVTLFPKVSDYSRDQEINKSVSTVQKHIPNDWAETKMYKQGGSGSISAARVHTIEYKANWSLEQTRKILTDAGGSLRLCQQSSSEDSCRAVFDKYCVIFSKIDSNKIRLDAGSLHCGETYDL